MVTGTVNEAEVIHEIRARHFSPNPETRPLGIFPTLMVLGEAPQVIEAEMITSIIRSQTGYEWYMPKPSQSSFAGVGS
ncbi:hypothetical protein BOTNAR_0130g00200 [Botryotinia narcissicola]|uniref:Uncharacterized protein n=1 Tax=Botryotinia narcissicola TaxID=278944 RepID=A0A4Z1IXS7_9HELO|nr:hypothetical protein BOTNAR_0130g00200 [Botryotinia narcissicola]